MKTIIIALLFRLSTGKKTFLEKIEFILFIIDPLLANTSFQDAASQALLSKLKDAAQKASEAATKAESNATADIKARDAAVRKMDRLYKSVALAAEEICSDDEDKAEGTGLTLHKKKTKKNPFKPENVKADGGKQDGEIVGKCKALGQGFYYLWFIRKASETTFDKPITTSKSKYTFTGLEPGTKYVICVASKTANGTSEISAEASCRAKQI